MAGVEDSGRVQENGAACYVSPGSPPSSYAVAAVYEGDSSGWLRVALGTAQRAVFIIPGLYVAGVRKKPLLLGALLGSVGITAMLFMLYGLQRRGVVKAWAQTGDG